MYGNPHTYIYYMYVLPCKYHQDAGLHRQTWTGAARSSASPRYTRLEIEKLDIWKYEVSNYIKSYAVLAPSYPNSEKIPIPWIHRTPDLSLWTHCFPNLFPCVWHVSHPWIDWLRWEDLSAQFGNCLAPCRCLVLFLKCCGPWMS